MDRQAASERRRAFPAFRMLRASITVRCLICIVAYAAALAALFWAASSASNALFDNAFPSMETVLEYEGELREDDFSALQTRALENCDITVFDQDGTMLYASSERIARKIHARDLSMINEYSDQGFYEIYQEQTSDGLQYRILQCTYMLDGGLSKQIDAWCVLDSDLNIIDGTLFSDRDALTQREFDFIQGIFSAQLSIERFEYETTGNEARTLVLVTPLVTERRYQKVVDESSRIALYAAPVAVAATICAAWYMARVIKRGVGPLDRAICANRRGEGTPADAERVPVELAGVYENFTDLMDELRGARDDQQRIIADISHDLKTPLTVIYGYANAFRDGRVPPEKTDEYHRAMADKALAACDLIDTLVAYAKMEHPEYQATLVRMDAREAVRAVADEARAQVDQAGCALEVADASAAGTGPGAAPAPVRIDTQLFRRLMLNLIGNACAHNPAGTTIRLACAVDRAAHTVRIAVADTGQGIDPKIAARMFKPFVTSNAARATGAGTGLGLAIARRCAELMGGTLSCTVDPPKPWATEFVFEIPLDDEGSGDGTGSAPSERA